MRSNHLRVQAIVCRGDRVLMVKHRWQGREFWCLPGGAAENGESPEEGALRELLEECRVEGEIIRRTSLVSYGPLDEHVTFLVDIGDQEPCLGCDPEVAEGEEILIGVGWMALSELTERDRAWLWSAGLLGVDGFLKEVADWEDETSADRWYSCTALFKAVQPGAVRRRHLWERTTFILRASDESSAIEKAERMAAQMEHEYEAVDGHLLRWVFQSVEGLQQLLDDEIGEGTEVCWEHFERVDKRS